MAAVAARARLPRPAGRAPLPIGSAGAEQSGKGQDQCEERDRLSHEGLLGSAVSIRAEMILHAARISGRKRCKQNECQHYFGVMVFAQVAQVKSLREVCDGLHCAVGKVPG